jgi:small acid-soluble spore protein B (major beta-type SASP)
MCFYTIYCYKGGEKHMANNNSSNQLLVPGVQSALDSMKYEIATEFGVQLGADSTARANGSVGGEITKRLVQMAEQQLGGFQR